MAVEQPIVPSSEGSAPQAGDQDAEMSRTLPSEVRSAATAREEACREWCAAAGYVYETPLEREGEMPPHIEAFLAGFTTGTRTYEDALAWSQQRLRAFAHEADADEVLGWYGLTYEEPNPVVRHG